MTIGFPLVSVITIFFNEERFLADAIASVHQQTFGDWELLLVDDGSTDGSAMIARQAASRHPDRVRYLQHLDGANLGMSASRNLGINHARGVHVSFLDGDDVWRPRKLEHQVAIVDRDPALAMTIAPLLRWRSWADAGPSIHHDDLMGVGSRKFGSHPYAGQVVKAPRLLELMLRDDYFIPGGALIRRDVLHAVGLYDERFRTLYEDALVMAKVAACFPVFVDDEVHYLYRIHPDSSTNSETDEADIVRKRRDYLDAVEEYLSRHELLDRSLRARLWMARGWRRRQRWRRLAIAVFRGAGRHALPRSLRDRLRRQWWERSGQVLRS